MSKKTEGNKLGKPMQPGDEKFVEKPHIKVTIYDWSAGIIVFKVEPQPIGPGGEWTEGTKRVWEWKQGWGEPQDSIPAEFF